MGKNNNREGKITCLHMTIVDLNHPLYLLASNTLGLLLIPIQLTGDENYGL